MFCFYTKLPLVILPPLTLPSTLELIYHTFFKTSLAGFPPHSFLLAFTSVYAPFSLFLHTPFPPSHSPLTLPLPPRNTSPRSLFRAAFPPSLLYSRREGRRKELRVGGAEQRERWSKDGSASKGSWINIKEVRSKGSEEEPNDLYILRI